MGVFIPQMSPETGGTLVHSPKSAPLGRPVHRTERPRGGGGRVLTRHWPHPRVCSLQSRLRPDISWWVRRVFMPPHQIKSPKQRPCVPPESGAALQELMSDPAPVLAALSTDGVTSRDSRNTSPVAQGTLFPQPG